MKGTRWYNMRSFFRAAGEAIMKQYNCALLRGVALIVENPEGEILVLRELKSKPWLGKWAGMYSIPMETIKTSESDKETLQRLRREELGDLEVEIESEPRGTYQVVRIARLKLYVGRTKTKTMPNVNGSKEVDQHQWKAPRTALDMWVRRGVREMLEDYIAGAKGVFRICRPARKQLNARVP